MAQADSSSAETTGFFRRHVCILDRLDGKTALVTGANTGIGKYTACELARRGAKVVLASRNLEKTNKCIDELVEMYGAGNPKYATADTANDKVSKIITPITKDQFFAEQVDLSSLQSVRDFVKNFESKHNELHLLVNNAGLFEEKYTQTSEGFEFTMAANQFGPVLLTELLLPMLKRSAPSRIIFVSSLGHRFYDDIRKYNLHLKEADYGGMKAYCLSKLANVMFIREMAKQLGSDSKVEVASVHPGGVRTELNRNVKSTAMKTFSQVIRPLLISPWAGAQTTLFCCLTHHLVSGGYYDDCKLTNPSKMAMNDEECKWLYDKCLELVKP